MSLQRLYDLDRSYPDQLNQLLHDKQYVDGLRELPERELFQLVDHLNDVLTRLDRTGGSSRKCLHVLRKICGFRKVLPATYELSRDLSPPTQPPSASGGFCDAYEGTLNVKVCIKRLKIAVTGDQEKIKELFCKEAVVWKHLNHPNIVPFKGVTFDPPQLVSEWMPGGELRHYVKGNWDADLIGLSLGVAEGLAYLHSHGVIHGDLKGQNIMVDESGNPLIMDFGLAKIARASNSLVTTTEGQGQSFRWTAPELFGPNQVVNMESDVFSFGMVMIEIFTGDIPFKTFTGVEVVMRIVGGERPGRPNHPKFIDHLWELTQRCWNVAQDRPKMEEVLKELSTGRVTETLPTLPRESSGPTGSPPMTATETSANSGEVHPLPSQAETPRPGSGPSPVPPQKAGGDGDFVHVLNHLVTGGTANGLSLGRPSDSGANNPPESSSDGGDRRDRGGLDTDKKLMSSVYSSVLPGPLMPEQTKKHGLWCRARSLVHRYILMRR